MPASTSAKAVRRAVAVMRGQPTSDGAGVKLTRMLGHQGLPDLDPFLLLDQIRSDDGADYIAGFPEHPHRGFETVTIMLDGRMRHGDSVGNAGVIGPGGVQWMTAGRGIIHAERPEQEDGVLWGFQLWINLPASRKMTAPRYQEYVAEEIPVDERPGASTRVIAGTTGTGVSGPAVSEGTEPLLLDVRLDPGAQFAEDVRFEDNVIVAVYAGSLMTPGRNGLEQVADPQLAILSHGDEVRVTAGPDGARFLLIAGRPLREPVVRHGPFVMNTEAEIYKAFADFHSGDFGR